MKNEIKILLTSDLHLGMDAGRSSVPENIRVNTFKKITALAQEHDILLIAGDLIDNVAITRDMIDLISSELNMVRDHGTEIVYCPGQGEQDGRGVIADFIYDLNVSCLFSNPVYSSPFSMKKGKQNLFIYGIPAKTELEIASIKKEDEEGFHLGLFYADFNNNRGKNISKNLDLDFYAMGSNHNFKMFKVFDKIIGAYPGSPEAVETGETGDRYVISMLVKNNEVVQIKRLTVNSLRLRHIDIDCSAYHSARALRDHLMGQASQKDIATILLSGARGFPLDDEMEVLRGRFFDMVLVDNSRPTMTSMAATYGAEDSIRGIFFTLLKERMENQDIPADMTDDLVAALKVLTVEGLPELEEWLCAISDA